MAKKYHSAELQVVRINNNDIVTLSATVGSDATNGMQMETAGRRMDDWDAGY